MKKLIACLLLFLFILLPSAAVAQDPPVQDAPASISLFLDNADIYQVIRIIGDALNLNYVIDPSVRGTVNINTSGTLMESDLLPILEAILRINGATMIQTGNFYSIVPVNTAVRQPLEVQNAMPAVLADDQMVMQVVRLKFIPAGEMAALLNPFVGEGGSIVVHNSGGILLITDRRSNLRKLLEIVDIYESDQFAGNRVRLFPVQNNLVRDVIGDLQAVFAGYGLSDRSSAVRFSAITRMNSILAVASNPEVFPEVERWIGVLDQPVQTSGLRNYVYKVRNAKAVDIHRVLSQLYSATPGAAPRATGAPVAPAGAPPVEQSGVAEEAPPADAFFDSDVRIIADEVNNSLLVQATPQQYAEILRTIEQLDLLPRQVLIDAQIYEVILDDSLSFGISAALQNRGTLAEAQGVANPQTLASFTNAAGLGMQTFAFVGRAREVALFLNASENRSRVRSLSAPSVLVSDNMTAQFQVGAEVPIPTSSSVTPVQSDGTNLFAQTIQYRTTGVIMTVRPQINEGGRVTMEIVQEVSQATVNTTSEIVAPMIGTSEVRSTIVVQDGQTIALGGFIRENRELATRRVPIIGRVPILGALFGSTLRGSSRSELIVLITPHVLTTHDEAALATEELKSRLQEIQRMMN